MSIMARTVSNPWMALGLATHFVARHQPFAGFPAGDLIRTIDRQISRQHYLFAFDTTSDPARVVGFFGWSLYSNADADQFASTGKLPSNELTEGGQVIWILTAVAESEAAFRTIVRKARESYPHHRVMAIRHKNGKRVIFDQSRSRVAERSAEQGRKPG